MNGNSGIQSPLSFDLANKEGKPAIHIMDVGDESNELTLTLKNHTGSPIRLKGGTPVEESKLTQASPSTFYVYFNRMLSKEDIEQIQVTTNDAVIKVPYFNGTNQVSLNLNESVDLDNFIIKARIKFSQIEPLIFEIYGNEIKLSLDIMDFTTTYQINLSVSSFYLDQIKGSIDKNNPNTLKMDEPYEIFLTKRMQEYKVYFYNLTTKNFIYKTIFGITKSTHNFNNISKIRIGSIQEIYVFKGEISELVIWNQFFNVLNFPLLPHIPEGYIAYFPTFATLESGLLSINQTETSLSWREDTIPWDINVQHFSGKFGTYLALTPKQDIELGDSLSFSLKNLNAAPLAKTNYVSIDYRNIPGVPDGTMQSELFVFKLPSNQLLDIAQKALDKAKAELEETIPQKVQHGIQQQLEEFRTVLDHLKKVENYDVLTINALLASVKNLNKPQLLCGFTHTNRIYVGQRETNELVLYLTNASQKTVIEGRKPQPSKTEAPNPRFIISFVCSNNTPSDVGALATKDDLNEVSINYKQQYGNNWHNIQKDAQSQDNVSWTIKPQNSTQILGIDKNATLELQISNIPVINEGVTLMYIEYKDIEGYEDSCFTLPIEKVQPVVIDEFTVDNAANLPRVTLKYKVSNATSIICSPPKDLPNPIDSVEQSIEFVIDQTTTFKLIARNEKTGQEVFQEVTVDYPQPPLGTIMMWSGKETDIPKGWALCNGNRYKNVKNPDKPLITPNLIGRFVLGGDGSNNINPTGGSATVKLKAIHLPSHNHKINDVGHRHQVKWMDLKWTHPGTHRVNWTNAYDGWEITDSDKGYSEYTPTGITIEPYPEKDEDTKSFDIMPLYYKLAYIMRVGDYQLI
ncbi:MULTISPECIES: hypothetical protein [unclassified Nostoc]|uniref:hypothetical protein n=1 Tax=unclassified Nostoc TaxID=2593658 RepID=UPI0026383A4F|nr:hypothetical protein [Nostoc sp. S13]MDF5736622.1 hypothetical protein [Nostoc sp. S13]